MFLNIGQFSQTFETMDKGDNTFKVISDVGRTGAAYTFAFAEKITENMTNEKGFI